MSSASVLLAVAAVAAVVLATAGSEIKLAVDSSKGLQVFVTAEQAKVGASRILPVTTPPPPPTTPTATTQLSSTTTTSVSSSSTSTTTASSTMIEQSTTPASTMPSTTPPPPMSTGKVEMQLASIRELDNSSMEVSPSNNILAVSGLTPVGPPSFPQNTTLPASNGVYGSCQSVEIALPVSNTTKLRLTLCAIENNGTATYTNEVNPLFEGQLSVRAEILGWPWTFSGQFLEVNWTLTVPPGKQLSMTSSSGVLPVTVSLGTMGSYAMLAGKVTGNYGTFLSMLPQYPMLIQNNPANQMANVSVILPLIHGGMNWNAVLEPGYLPGQPGPVAAANALFSAWLTNAVSAVLACWIAAMIGRQ